MAGFGDSNDIKITVTLDTKDAVDATKKLTDEINVFLSRVDAPFKKLAEVSKEASKVQVAEIRAKRDIELETLSNLDKADQRKHERVIERLRQEVDLEKVASAEFLRLEKIRVDESIKLAQQKQAAVRQSLDATTKENIARINTELEAEKSRNVKEAKDFSEKEKTKRAEINQTIAEINKQAAEVRKGKGGGSLGDTAGSGKLVDALKNSVAGLSYQFGNVNIGFASFINNFKNLGAVGGSIAAVIAAVGAIQRFDKQIDELADKANKVEGLATGFETLQKSVGQDPSASIQKLREATQGLVSDVALYQRANQAVLLGVPTDTFNEAAAAAVKLGRAMGIDAAFGLESLSLGLGRQSRLYLDNLGIVVSAEEAYANFAVTIGKTANDLTDAEKKQAFFAEALRKIKERADELPDPLDSVGIALQRLQAAQENANTKFSEGISRSKELIDAYKEQARQATLSAEQIEKYGAAVGVVGGITKSLANDFRAFGLIARSVFTDVVDVFADLTKEDQLVTLKESISDLEESTNQLREARARAENEGDQFSPTLANRLKEQEAALKAAREEAEKLEAEIIKLRGEGDKGIKINVDLSSITEARNAFTGLFSNLGQDTLESVGQISVPGISPEALAQATSAYEQLVFNLNRGTISASEFNAEFQKIQTTVGQSTTGIKVDELTQSLNKLRQESTEAGANQEDLAAKIKIASEQLEEAKKQAGLYGETATQLTKAFQEAGKKGKKSADDLASAQKNAAKQAQTALKQQQQQLKELTKSLGRALDQAIPDNVQQQLVDVFNDPQLSAEELRAKIQALGEEFLRSGGDFQAFAKEVGGLNDLKNELPDRPIVGGAQQQAELDEYNKSLINVQKSAVNLRDIFFGEEYNNGKKAGGGFFGFDLGKAFGPETEAQIASSVGGALQTAFSLAVDGFTRDDVPELAGAIGGALGTAIGAYFGDEAGGQAGAVIGTELGKIVGEALKTFGEDTQGTKERKTVDKYFADLFDGDRLGIIIEGEVFKAVKKRREGGLGAVVGGVIGGAIFGPIGAGIGAAIGAGIDDGVNTVGQQLKEKIPPTFIQLGDLVFDGFTRFAGDVRFGIEEAGRGFNAFSSYFNTLPATVQNSFNGIGLAYGQLLGLSEEQSKLIGTALANNIGGSLQNLQVLIQATGESAEDMAASVIKSFLDSKLSIDDAYNALVQIQGLYEQGIPGAIGAYQEAIDNLNNSLRTDSPGRYAIDSLRDIGAEGQEAGAAFTNVISSLAQTFGFAADQQARLFEALKLSGINSLQQLAKASDEQLLTLLKNINAIRENAEAPLASVPATAPAPSGSGGARKKSPKEIAAELLKKQTDEARKLVGESQKYLDILDKIANKELTRVDGGKALLELQKQALEQIQKRDRLEKAINAELDKGAKASPAKLAGLEKQLKAVEKALEELNKKTGEATRNYKQLDISGIIPLIKDSNNLGVVARQVGVSLEANVDTLVKGFLQGRLSIAEVNAEIQKTKDLLGGGIPEAVGAVDQAFKNLQDAGTKGGAFSTDAFRDIFAEFREKFNTEGSAIREEQRKQLVANLDAARRALASATGPEATEAAKKSLDTAKKALQDFYDEVPAPDLADLRDQLSKTFGTEEIDKFFRALDESGLKSFEDFEKAGDTSIIAILGRLEQLGFKFGQTSGDISKINDGLQEAEKDANDGFDPLKEAIDLVKSFNDATNKLPAAFNDTTAAAGKLNGPLTKIAKQFSDIVEKLGLLGGNRFENDVVFNIRTIGDKGGQALIDIIFGDGSDAGSDTGNGSSGSTNTRDSDKKNGRDSAKGRGRGRSRVRGRR